MGTTTVRRCMVNSFTWPSERRMVRVTEEPSLPVTVLRTSVVAVMATPSTAMIRSPAWSPASLAGELGRIDKTKKPSS